MSEVVELHVHMLGDSPEPSAEVAARMSEEMYKGARRAAEVLEGAAHAVMAPNAKTGRSMSSVTGEVDVLSPLHMQVTLGSSSKAVRWNDEGTGIYGRRGSPIFPLTARALKFPHRGVRYGGQVKLVGDYAFARWVRGIRPRHYFDRVYEMTHALVTSIFDDTADAMARHL